MANSDSEAVPLLELSAKDEDDLDESRETETTDDECHEEVEERLSYLEQPGCSSDYSSNYLVTDIEKPGCSSDYPSNYWVTDIQKPGCSSDYPSNYYVTDIERPGCSSDYSSRNLASNIERSTYSSEYVIDDISGSSACTIDSQVAKGKDAMAYFAGELPTSSSDSNKTNSLENSVDLGCVVEYTVDEKGNVDYIDIDFDETISEKHVSKLMTKISHNHYTSISCEGDFTLSKCKGLLERDFYCETIDNFGGVLSRNYPVRVIIPVARKSQKDSSERLAIPVFSSKWYLEKIKTSVYSRLLTRFVVPVILFDNKFICRSGSLTVRKSATYESARQLELPKDQEIPKSTLQHMGRKVTDSITTFSNRTFRAAIQMFSPRSMAKLRDVDAEVMKHLKIKHVCDLMLQKRKKFIKTIKVSSSEKVNKDIFKDTAIEQMPYPGCSFFRKYHDAGRSGHELFFNWTKREVDVEMKFSVDPYEIFPHIDWKNYKEWDIYDLTKNYLKMMLVFLVKDGGGLLIHCISGWDRTPLFVSLLRVSLWADGLIHESLNYRDMAYLTLAYDWYLFGHDLPSRLSRKQEIMHFCFNFLVHIISDEFSLTRIFHELPEEMKKGRRLPKYEPGRREVLKVLRLYIMDVYEEYITKNIDCLK